MKTLEMRSHELPRRIYGIDFSGAKDAGKKIWVAGGNIEGSALHIKECWRASELTCTGSERSMCLFALRKFITKWEKFILSFPENYSNDRDFRDKCRKDSHNREIKRRTDVENKTPFSPYNLRVYRQTFYGIRDILNPLVQKKQVYVLPMQRRQCGKPGIIEICPASTLKKKNMYKPYKGKEHREQRKLIFEALENTGSLSITKKSIREKILDNIDGDTLDSVIAAYATFCAWRNHFAVENNENYGIEGYVFA
jgi:hypothetical protein